MSARRWMALALLSSLAGCAGSTEPQASLRLDDALAMISLSTMIPHANEQLLTPLPSSVGRTLDPAHCTYAAASQRFVCDPYASASWADTSSFVLLDANGTPQSLFDPATTASVRTDMAIGFSTPRLGKVRQLLTLSGLREGQATLDGTQTVIWTSCTIRSCSIYGETTTIVLAGVVLPPSGSATPWPTAGTLTFREGDSSDQLTFNGTSSVPVVEVSVLGTRHCTLDLLGTSASALACPRYF